MIKRLILTIILTVGMTLLIGGYAKVNAAIEEPVAGMSMDFEDIKPTFVWVIDKVNLRSEASLNSDIITTLDKRTKLLKAQMNTSSEKWIKVIYNGKVGYVYSDYVTDKEFFQGTDNRWGINLTDDEIDLLAKIVWIEARGESDTGEAAIVEVVLNRMYSLEYSDTLYEVLSEHNAFTSWKLRNTAKPTEREYEIIEEVLHDEWNVLSMDVMYFSTSPRNDNVETKIGEHYFCKEVD